MKRIVGVDVGLSGAFCFMTFFPDKEMEVTFEPMPLIGSDLDFHRLAYIFSVMSDATIFIEKVTPFKMGVTGAFKFGRQAGALEAMAHAFRITHVYVTPQSWQKVMHESTSRASMPNPKQRSLAVARRLFPTLELRKKLEENKFSKFPDEGFVDSLMIAEYGRRRLGDLHGEKRATN